MLEDTAPCEVTLDCAMPDDFDFRQYLKEHGIIEVSRQDLDNVVEVTFNGTSAALRALIHEHFRSGDYEYDLEMLNGITEVK